VSYRWLKFSCKL